MRNWVRIVAAGAVMVWVGGPLAGVQRFPPPEFDSGYQIPSPTTPSPSSDLWEYVNVAALAVALALAAYLILKKRSRVWIFALMIAALAWFGFVREGCVCPIGAIQNVTMGLFDREVHIRPDAERAGNLGVDTGRLTRLLEEQHSRFEGGELRRVEDEAYIRLQFNGRNQEIWAELGQTDVSIQSPQSSGRAIKLKDVVRIDYVHTVPIAILAVFSLPLVAALLFGRVFCGAVCPLGAVQDVVAIRPVAIPAWLGHVLGLLAYVYLVAAMLFAATGSAFVICRYDPFVSLFRLSGTAAMLVIGASLLLIGVFVARPYCRFLCPYGVLLGWASRLSKWRVKITPAECIQCRLCEDSCPFGAIRKANVPAPPVRRTEGRALLAGLIAVLPVLVILGGYLLSRASRPMARMHPVVSLADQVALERAGQAEPASTDATMAFRASGRKPKQLNEEAAELVGRFVAGGWILGGLLSLVIGGKLIGLSVRRRQSDYEADTATCLACGKCFSYCPIERKRRKELSGTEATT